MATPMLDPARLALARFGLGVSAGQSEADLAAIGRDPKGALIAELTSADPPLPEGLKTSNQLSAIERDFQRQVDATRAAARTMTAANAMTESAMATPTIPGTPGAAAPPNPIQQMVGEELTLRFSRACAAPIGLNERLVWFWSNHFCISMDKGGFVRAIAGAYEREVVRRHIGGRFAGMLMASARHPAMLAYLDNNRSIGPNSPAGRRQNRGLNENLAREILELHTLGVSGGYSQADVTAFANVLTGWTMGGPNEQDAVPFLFRFNFRTHEPGAKTVLGKTYPEGEAGGLALLADLAAHPSTATHVATKLVRHFVADDPPPAITAKAERAFIASGGDLIPTLRAVIEAPETWQVPPSKLRSPVEWVVAMHRGLGLDPEVQRLQRVLNILGQPTWRVPSPKGFADESAPWLDGLGPRVDIAHLLVRAAKVAGSPVPVAERLLGDKASRETLEAVKRAETTLQGLTIAFLSPEFLRR